MARENKVKLTQEEEGWILIFQSANNRTLSESLPYRSKRKAIRDSGRVYPDLPLVVED